MLTEKVREETLLFYEKFAHEFDSKMNMYDTRKRIDVVFDELLVEDITNKKVLDAGCGTGWFSKAAAERGGIVTSMDLGPGLLGKVREKCSSATLVVGSILDIPFPDNSFDVVISSEVIEHTVDPAKAIGEMHRVLKQGGYMVVTTPNKLWYFSVWLANTLKLRPYQGFENWISWKQFRKSHTDVGQMILESRGIHAFPFVVPFLNPVLDFFHRFNKQLWPIMVNMAIKSRKV